MPLHLSLEEKPSKGQGPNTDILTHATVSPYIYPPSRVSYQSPQSVWHLTIKTTTITLIHTPISTLPPQRSINTKRTLALRRTIMAPGVEVKADMWEKNVEWYLVNCLFWLVSPVTLCCVSPRKSLGNSKQRLWKTNLWALCCKNLWAWKMQTVSPSLSLSVVFVLSLFIWEHYFLSLISVMRLKDFVPLRTRHDLDWLVRGVN